MKTPAAVPPTMLRHYRGGQWAFVRPDGREDAFIEGGHGRWRLSHWGRDTGPYRTVNEACAEYHGRRLGVPERWPCPE